MAKLTFTKMPDVDNVCTVCSKRPCNGRMRGVKTVYCEDFEPCL